MWGAAFSGDGHRILSWSGNTIRLRDATTGQELLTLRHEEPVWGTVFSENERHILSRSADGTARVWNVATGRDLLTLRHEIYMNGAVFVKGAVFSGDERRILSWSGNIIRLWDATTGAALLTLSHQSAVWGAVFSGDPGRILSWSHDGTLRLWDAATGGELETLRHEGSVGGAVFSGDKRSILSWTDDGTARVWDISRMPKGHLIDVACGLLPDHDTPEIKDWYGIAITTPICTPGTPAPMAAELQD